MRQKRIFERLTPLLGIVIGASVIHPAAMGAVNVGSSSWVWQNPLPQGDNLNAISCPSTNICYAVGNEGTILHFNGSSWSSQFSTTTANLNGISCPSTTTCFAVGDFGTIVATNTSGSSWKKQNSGIPSNLTGVSCPSTSVCFAISGFQVIGTNAGLSSTPWGPFPGGTGNGFVAISCPLTTECYMANGDTVFRLAFTSGLWQNQPTPAAPLLNSGFLSSISCVSASTCAATVIGGNGPPYVIAVGTTTSGASWSQTTFSAVGSPSLENLSCFNGTSGPQCYAVGPNNQVFSGGLTSSSWSTTSVSGKFGRLSAVSCQPQLTGIPPFVFTVGICFAVGSQGNIITDAPSGSTWTSQQSSLGPPAVLFPEFFGVSCPQPGTCFATGSAFYGSTNGSAWKEINSTAGLGDGISCPTTLECLVTQGTQVSVTTDGGVSWSSAHATVRGAPQGGHAISCPSSQICVAAGQYIIFSNDRGSSWNAQLNFGNAFGVSCPSTTSCVVVGQFGTIVYTTNLGSTGTIWKQVLPPVTPNNLNGVSCPTTTDCYAVGDSGTILHGTFSGSTMSWKAETAAPTSGTGFESISCLPPTSSSSIFCEAYGVVGSQSGVIVTGPGTWQVETAAIDPGINLLGLSCTGSTALFNSDFECAAVGNPGTILTKTVVTNRIGTGVLTPHSGSSETGEPTTFELEWTVPGAQSWRDLKYLDLRLVATGQSSGEEEDREKNQPRIGLWARFIPGFPSAFALLDGNGNVVSEGVTGDTGVLDSLTATLDLAKSSFQAAGPTSPTVTVNFVVRFKPAAAGGDFTRQYDTEISATDLSGTLQGPEKVGHWVVQSSGNDQERSDGSMPLAVPKNCTSGVCGSMPH
jgi:photosystem II stability/assembly factor-like uncharacterized protein